MTERASITTTVVIPVWDRYVDARLTEAVASVAGQDRQSRIIVVDNASSVVLPAFDGVTAIRSDQRLSLGRARNLGLAEVTTPNVIFWDADDRMPPGTIGFLEDQLAADSGLIAFGAAIIDEPSGVRHRWPRRWIAKVVPYPLVFAVINAVWSMYPTTGSTIMRTSNVIDAGGYSDAEGGEDWGMGAALTFRGRVGWSERPSRHYLQHEGSRWDTYGTARHQLAYAAAVRERLDADPSVPKLMRRALPLVALAQWSAVGAHLAAAELRRLGSRGAPTATA